MHFHFAAFSLLALANTAFAHYRWTKLIANGAATGEYQHVRLNTNYNSPVTDVTSNDIRCNTGTQPNAAKTSTYSVAAGSTIGLGLDQAIYHQSVSGTVLPHPRKIEKRTSRRPTRKQANPPNPAIYMTKVSSAATADGSTPWFKVAELGPSFSNGNIGFPSQDRDSFTFTIPKSLPSGDYLLRAENIAIHAASSANGAQFYISCAQITVTGGGSGTPGPTVSLPGAYKATDPGLLINIYYPIPTSYKYPGPAVWKG